MIDPWYSQYINMYIRVFYEKECFFLCREQSKTINSNEKKESAYHKLWSLVPPSTTPCVSDIVVVAAGSVEVASVEVGSLLSVVVTASVELSCSPHVYTKKLNPKFPIPHFRPIKSALIV